MELIPRLVPETKFTILEQLPPSPKVLVLDLGFLGDSIHLIPALNCIHKTLPEAELHVMVADHIKGILDVVPYVDEVLGYPRFPKGPKWYQDYQRIKGLRSAKYDLVINLNGSDRSSILTMLSGAPLRLGRHPRKRRWWWSHTVTHECNCPYGQSPIYVQSVKALQGVGFAPGEPVFDVVIPGNIKNKVKEMVGDMSHYIHVSPFTTEDYKELPEALLADFLNHIHRVHSESLVISVAPNDRERSKLQSLLRRLTFKPDQIFDGTLSLLELAEVIDRASIHIGGDSGALHIALMCKKPTFAWFRQYEGLTEWMPTGSDHANVVGEAFIQGIKDISLEDLERNLRLLVDKEIKLR